MPQYVLDTSKNLAPPLSEEERLLHEVVYNCGLEVGHHLELLLAHNREPNNQNVLRVFTSGLDLIIAKYDLTRLGGLEEEARKAIQEIKVKAHAAFSLRAGRAT